MSSLSADDCEGDNAWGVFVLVLFLMLSATGLFLAYMKYCVQARKDGHEPCPEGTIPLPITMAAEKACMFCETLSGDAHAPGTEGNCLNRTKACCTGFFRSHSGSGDPAGEPVQPVETVAPAPAPAPADSNP